MRKDSVHLLSRREFGRGLIGAAAAVGAARVIGQTGPVMAAASSFPSGKYVDVHVHLTQSFGRRAGLTRDQLLAWMNQRQVAQVVVLPLISPEGWYFAISNDWVLEQTAGHRDRLIPFCDIDPRCTYVKTPKAIREQLELYVEAGAKGLDRKSVV